MPAKRSCAFYVERVGPDAGARMQRVAVAVAAIALLALAGCANDDPPSREPESTRTQRSSPTLPVLPLPGLSSSPAGEYGWQGGSGEYAWMHHVVGGGNTTTLVFTVGHDCLGASQEQQAVPVRIAGFDAMLVEPWQPLVESDVPLGDAMHRAHQIAIGERTLCAIISWQPQTTDDNLDAAMAVLDTLRAEPVGEDQIRITFTLEDGWDTG